MQTLLAITLVVCAAFVSGQFTVKIQLVGLDPLELNFTISNPSSYPERILQRGTPLEGTWTNMFDIRDKHYNKVEYIGKLARRVPIPIDEEYLTIPAGGSVSSTVDLGDNYEFLSVGSYVVRVDLPLYSELKYLVTEEQVVSFDIHAIPARKPSQSPQGYTNCNANQVSLIGAAIRGSITESARAYNCLSGRTCDSVAVTWFGTYNQANRNFDINVFRNVNSRLNNYEFNGYCNPPGCGANVYGYVYPTDTTYTVYLCGAFWRLPAEQVNTIVHEMSHFRTLGGTNDYAYGKPNCRSLAISDPYSASRNADNVCYFSESV